MSTPYSISVSVTASTKEEAVSMFEELIQEAKRRNWNYTMGGGGQGTAISVVIGPCESHAAKGGR